MPIALTTLDPDPTVCCARCGSPDTSAATATYACLRCGLVAAIALPEWDLELVVAPDAGMGSWFDALRARALEATTALCAFAVQAGDTGRRP